MNDTLHIHIRDGENEQEWRIKAINALKAEALRKDLDWKQLQVVIRVPDPHMFMTKDPGHTILITRRIQ